MAQVGCWMSKDEAEKLDDYAAKLELTRPSVCVLLVQRELREPRLEELRKRFPVYPCVKEARVTARIDNPKLKEAFAEHVGGLGLGSDEAAWLLFRAEPKDQWLLRTLGWRRITFDSASIQGKVSQLGDGCAEGEVPDTFYSDSGER